MGSDSVEPRRDMRAVEGRQPAMHDHEDFLYEIVVIRGWAPERTDPTRHMFDPIVVDGTEVERPSVRSVALTSEEGGYVASNRLEMRC